MQIGHTQSSAAIKSSSTDRSQVSDKALVRSMADGDKRALKILYVRHHARVFRFIMRITGDELVAEDVVNDVFLEAWRRADKFEGRSQVATWLMAIARFRAITRCKRRSEAQLDERAAAVIEDPSDTPSTAFQKRERSDILQRCLAKLTPLHREVISQIYYQDKKIDEVARFTGVPVSTIKTRMHYARGRMAELLMEAGVDQSWLAI
jgi:RNA polymerase sigma-70 factor (ECF subfamily)